MKGIVVKTLSGFYYVSREDAVYECKARGSLRKDGVSPLVGDRVVFEIIGEKTGVLEEVLPRKNCFRRPPVSNIDKLFIVSSYQTPAPNLLLIDRLTAAAVHNGTEPVIVFNKCDTGCFDKLIRIYTHAGFRTYAVSAETGEGISALRQELFGCVSAFAGNSGVGKSSILNRVAPTLSLKVGEVSEKLGRGRHTTRHTELFSIGNGGFVVDTPGFSAVEEHRNEYAFKEKLSRCFPEFEVYIGGCRFSSCTHTCENGCAVLQAIRDGAVEPSRHRSYCELFEEMKDLKPWDTEKRKKM